jgi:hypothetical protein
MTCPPGGKTSAAAVAALPLAVATLIGNKAIRNLRNFIIFSLVFFYILLIYSLF